MCRAGHGWVLGDGGTQDKATSGRKQQHPARLMVFAVWTAAFIAYRYNGHLLGSGNYWYIGFSP